MRRWTAACGLLVPARVLVFALVLLVLPVLALSLLILLPFVLPPLTSPTATDINPGGHPSR